MIVVLIGWIIFLFGRLFYSNFFKVYLLNLFKICSLRSHVVLQYCFAVLRMILFAGSVPVGNCTLSTRKK